MNRKFRSFYKSITFNKIFIKIALLFFTGFFFRFLVNYLLDSNLWLELTALFMGGLLPINAYHLLPSSTELIEKNMSLIKSRPRDLIIGKDYDLIDRCRRRAHWVFFNQFDSKFKSYSDYSKQWKVDSKLTEQFIDKYKEIKWDISIQKKTLLWLISPKNR